MSDGALRAPRSAAQNDSATSCTWTGISGIDRTAVDMNRRPLAIQPVAWPRELGSFRVQAVLPGHPHGSSRGNPVQRRHQPPALAIDPL